MKRSQQIILVILLLTLSSLSGCAARRPPAEPQPRLQLNWERETPQSLLASLQTKTEALNAFTAYFQISMDPPPKGMPSSFSGVLYLHKEATRTSLRIKAFHMFGTTLFDMVAQDGTTRLYIPSQRTLYVGRMDQNAQDGNQGPQAVFSAMLIDFSRLNARPHSTLTIGRHHVKLPLEGGEIWLDKETGHIVSLSRGDKTISYGNYQELQAGKPAMPTEINLTTATGKARCLLKEVTLQDKMAPSNFDISHYQVKETKPLSAATKR
ncbi:MAG: hypothetical protein C0613_07855 [Desulfobulbaceae bacterium]|nr:MAG: hypothetical protein C0613_07855 [Desulfobulbaceae bacterium]